MKKGMIISAVIVVMAMMSFSGEVVANSSKYDQTAVVAQDDVTYAEVKVDDLPDAVTKSLKDGYADYEISKAYKGSDDSYKVELTKENEKIAVYFNADGKFLKIEQEEDLKK